MDIKKYRGREYCTILLIEETVIRNSFFLEIYSLKSIAMASQFVLYSHPGFQFRSYLT